MARSEIESLRRQVERARQNSNRKVQRLRREKGVRIGLAPEVDPRRAKGVESRYNRAQLQSYLSELKGFNSRSRQFVAGDSGVPIRKEVAYQLEQAQKAFNLSRERMGTSIESVEIPGRGGITYGDVNRRRRNEIAGPLTRSEYQTKRMKSEQAVIKATESLRSRIGPGAARRETARAREVLDSMALNIGDAGALREKFSGMSDKQILAFWSNPAHINSLSLMIESDQAYEGWYDDDPSEIAEQQGALVWEHIDAMESVIR